MIAGPSDRDRVPQRIAAPDPDTHFQLIIELAARAEVRGLLIGPLGLAVRTSNPLAGEPDRRASAMVADRYKFIVRKQWSRAGTACPHFPHDECRCRNRYSHRSSPANAFRLLQQR